MKLIKALWKTIRELDVEVQLLILAGLYGILFVLGGIINSIIITIIFGFGFVFSIFKAIWLMGKEDFQEFISKVKENKNKLM